MTIGYSLFNATANERISFSHVSACTKREIAGNPVAAAIVAWYCLEHPGHDIAFVSDSLGDWPFKAPRPENFQNVPDVTDDVVSELVANGILADHGKLFVDSDEPDTVYIRDLRNVWREGS